MKKHRISALLLALVMGIPVCGAATAAEIAPETIDGTATVFVSSFGRMSYEGAVHTSYRSLEDGIAALGTDGGKVIFSGDFTHSGDSFGSGGALFFEGVGSTVTASIIRFAAPEISVQSDLQLQNLTINFPEAGKGLVMNGHNLVISDRFDTSYVVSDHTTGAHRYAPLVSVASGDVSQTQGYTFDIASGNLGAVLLASGNVAAPANLSISGGSFEKVVIGCADGSMNGDITATITGGSIKELIIGAENGSMNGNINVNLAGGTIENLRIGTAGADASFDGSAVISVGGAAMISRIEHADAGKSTARLVYLTTDAGTAKVASDAAFQNIISLKNGKAEPVFLDGKVALACFDPLGCSAEKLLLSDGSEIFPQDGVFVLPDGVVSGEIVSALDIGLNDEAVFINGYDDGGFHPQSNMTRAEAVTLLTRVVTNAEAVAAGGFQNRYDDVDPNAWYAPYFNFFAAAGLLTKIADGTTVSPDAPITRGEFVQLIYNIDTKLLSDDVSYRSFGKLVNNVSAGISTAEKFDAYSDVDYTNPYGNAVYHALVNGYVNGYDDGTFAPSGSITRAEVVTIVNRMLGRTPAGGSASFNDVSGHWAESQIAAAAGAYGEAWTRSTESGTTADGTSYADYVKVLMDKVENDSSRLVTAIATHVYKTASEAIISDDITPEQQTALQDVVYGLRSTARDKARSTFHGSPDDPINYIYTYFGGPYVRDVVIQGRKPGTDPVEIVQTSDTHFNLVNALDEEEKNPSIMSTKVNRTWLANGQSLPAVAKALDYAKYSDLTIVTGDVLDYLSHGCKQLTIENLFRVDTDVLACLGGHDTTRVMQGVVPDPSSYDSRLEFLREFWPHDIHYVSKVVKDKVMCIVMDNGASQYWPEQVPLLAADIETARENGYVVLIFEHEPICTKNPAETKVEPISANDPSTPDYCNTCVGREGSTGATKEVYDLITQNADVVRGVFCGHMHSDFYCEILGSYLDENGNKVDAVIPQYVLTATVYGGTGHVIRITVE